MAKKTTLKRYDMFVAHKGKTHGWWGSIWATSKTSARNKLERNMRIKLNKTGKNPKK
jgi:hypothetical protein